MDLLLSTQAYLIELQKRDLLEMDNLKCRLNLVLVAQKNQVDFEQLFSVKVHVSFVLAFLLLIFYFQDAPLRFHKMLEHINTLEQENGGLTQANEGLECQLREKEETVGMRGKARLTSQQSIQEHQHENLTLEAHTHFSQENVDFLHSQVVSPSNSQNQLWEILTKQDRDYQEAIVALRILANWVQDLHHSDASDFLQLFGINSEAGYIIYKVNLYL
ncbi:hypothetical protein GYMLUDRAFT_64611 [Collybiopsis luxurians FD-317 M1]|uniref:Unplaced genomic scaffold GYMLUscaffold_106, whole genome shotgun sequence n=1 Tax=Collybiopsis luxurians FD-317 M1 TaxID=944289 RepID=A0A0D0BQA6_9AGAR|nr:hypothetical protein GYMLUDRAFT_64611 [Collybiopsis luxurians FD-317 M1]